MKIYALKYKDEFIDWSDTEFKLKTNYHYERDEIKKDLTVVSGEFTEEVK